MADVLGSRDHYVAGFRDRVHAMRHPGQEIVDEPGILGLVGRSATALDGRVLVTDDRARATLAARLPDLHARVLYVFDEADACRQLLAHGGGLRAEGCTAMVCRRLDAVPPLDLPPGLRLRPVDVTPGGDGVPLVDAAVAALRSDPSAAPAATLDDFVAYLRSIPSARFLAAVDDGGAVQATAACAIWGTTAGVFFVNTDPAWRGRGIGTAITSAVLRTAAGAGATRACLDASSLGLSIYLRLGFEPAGSVTQFVVDR